MYPKLHLNFAVDILLKATANAPIMKQKKWSVCQNNPIGRISEFIKKYLKLDPNERLVHLRYSFIFFFVSRGRDNKIVSRNCNIFLFFSFFMLIKHLHRLLIRQLRISMIVMVQMENWSSTIARVKPGAKKV